MAFIKLINVLSEGTLIDIGYMKINNTWSPPLKKLLFRRVRQRYMLEVYGNYGR